MEDTHHTLYTNVAHHAHVQETKTKKTWNKFKLMFPLTWEPQKQGEGQRGECNWAVDLHGSPAVLLWWPASSLSTSRSSQVSQVLSGPLRSFRSSQVLSDLLGLSSPLRSLRSLKSSQVSQVSQVLSGLPGLSVPLRSLRSSQVLSGLLRSSQVLSGLSGLSSPLRSLRSLRSS